jgi:predicted phosphodiesterase
MKIAICSDIHLEFGDIILKNEDGADVLILGGDIMVAADLNKPDPYNIMLGHKHERMRDFMSRCSFQFPHVVYIMGNHEHYHGDYATSADKLRSFCSAWDNVHFLDKESVKIDDVTFIGGTLWTDMNREDSLTMRHIAGMMNDFRIVDNSNRVVNYKVPVYKKDDNGEYIYDTTNGGKSMIEDGHEFKTRVAKFSPADAVEDHHAMMAYVQTMIEGRFDEKFVVVGHHAPSKASTHPRYKDEEVMNGGYSTNLDDFIVDHPQIKLWTHGHTHEDFDYMVGSTRIVCNPRGYHDYEERAARFELKYVEI